MFQEHSYFSKPLIYFGTNEIEIDEIEEDSHSELWRSFFDLPTVHPPRTELFFHWYECDEQVTD